MQAMPPAPGDKNNELLRYPKKSCVHIIIEEVVTGMMAERAVVVRLVTTRSESSTLWNGSDSSDCDRIR